MSYITLPGTQVQMSDIPVTQKLWQKVMGNNPSYFKSEDNPVEKVSWNDANEFIAKLNSKVTKYIYRLPTEEEWNLAAGDCDKDYEPLKEYAWYCDNSGSKPHSVKKKKSNKLGFYDMLGNVWEWTADNYDLSGSGRVIRGGSWGSNASDLRSAYRYYAGPGYRYGSVGFRLVRTRRNPLPSNSLSLDSEAIALAIAKVQSALDELKVLVGK